VDRIQSISHQTRKGEPQNKKRRGGKKSLHWCGGGKTGRTGLLTEGNPGVGRKQNRAKGVWFGKIQILAIQKGAEGQGEPKTRDRPGHELCSTPGGGESASRGHQGVLIKTRGRKGGRTALLHPPEEDCRASFTKLGGTIIGP